MTAEPCTAQPGRARLARRHSASRLRRVLLAALLLAWTEAAVAQALLLENYTPRGLRVGSETSLVLEGEGVGRVDRLLFDRPGLTATGLQPGGDSRLEAKLSASADCPPGEHAFWLVSGDGVSKVATLWVARLRELTEEAAADRPLTLSPGGGVTIAGKLSASEVDRFKVLLEAGERLSAEIEAMRSGLDFFDARIDLFGPDGEAVAAADDCPRLKQDSAVSLLAEAGGVYTVAVRDAAFDADFDSRYRLHLGGFARPMVAYPCGWPGGQATNATLLGDAAGPDAGRFTLPEGPDRIVPLWPGGGETLTPSPILVRRSRLPNVLEQAAAAPTSPPAVPVAFNGLLGGSGEVDRFDFRAEGGTLLDIEAFAARVGSPVDTVLKVFDSSGRQLNANDDGFIHDSRVLMRVPRDGVYTLAVSDHLGRGGDAHVYRVEVKPPELSIAVTLPELDARNALRGAIVVPRGGRVAALVALGRRGFSGPLRVLTDSLPSGVTCQVRPVGPTDHLAVLLLEAAAGAPRSAGFFDLRAETLDGSVVGQYRQSLGVVRGQPRQTAYHSVTLDRPPIVIADPAPLAIDVDKPTLSLPADGRLTLRVELERAAGFDGEVRLSSPQLPGWVSTSEDPPVIDSGEGAAFFPLVGESRLPAGRHEVVLVATADTDTGEVSVASRLVALESAPAAATGKIVRAVGRQGQRVRVVCGLDWAERRGAAWTARLLGLPKGAKAGDVAISAGADTVAFDVQIGPNTPPAAHNTLLVELTRNDESGASMSLYTGRGGVLEVLTEGEQPATQISPLEALRRREQTNPGTPKGR